METPTNHTSASFFRDLGLEPDDTLSASMDENSSIAESNIFADYSAHSRFLSSGAAAGTSNQIQGRIRNLSGGQSLLGPLEEGEDDPAIDASHSSVRSTRQDNEANGLCPGPPAQPQPPPPPPPPPPRPLNKEQKASSMGQPSQQQTARGGQPLKSALKRPSIGADAPEESCNNSTAGTAATFATNKTFGAVPGNVPSETLHTSNMTFTPRGPVGLPSGNHIGRNNQHDVDRAAAWAIHAALILLCGLVVIAVLLSFVVVRKYGLIALLGLMVVVTFVVFLACFIDKIILSANPRLRPLRQKILTVVKATRNLLAEEYQLFMNDYNDHMLLLTNGGGGSMVGAATEIVSSKSNGAYPTTPRSQASSLVRRKHSIVFRLVKPVLGLKKKLFSRSRGGTQNRGSSSSHPASSSLPLEYHPPTVSENSIVVV